MTVTTWWAFLSIIAVLNIGGWIASFAAVRRGQSLPTDFHATRRLLLIFSGLYVFGCAYRSFFLVYDVPRICMVDSVLASVLVGRTVATVAELSFVAQWALLLRESARAAGCAVGSTVARVLVPLIAVAETCSWYAVLTTSNLGHVAEESLWGLAVALLVASVVVALPRSAPARRPVLAAWCTAGLVYVAFMFAVDVPMYWSRWLADEAVGRHYLTLSQGLFDVAHRRIVSTRWDDWKNEMVWMSLYFSVAVWISIALIHAPPFKAAVAARKRSAQRVDGSVQTG